MAWTEKDIPNLKGKTAMVTGANSGLGFQTSVQLAKNGARVVMACRNMTKAEESLQQIKGLVPNADIEIIQVDLGNLRSIHECADDFMTGNGELHMLINNAGIGGFPFAKTTDGFESHFGINHLGHYLLTGKLLPLIKSTPGSRVVSVSSIMSRIGWHKFEDINYERRSYNKWHAYGRSKFANILFSNELNRKFQQNNCPSLAATAHPGYSSTSFQGKGPAADNSAIGVHMMKVYNALFAQTDVMGAMPTLYAAVSDEVSGGDYVGPSFLRLRGYPNRQRALQAAYDKKMAAKLWLLSEELTRFTYSF